MFRINIKFYSKQNNIGYEKQIIYKLFNNLYYKIIVNFIYNIRI